MAPTFNAIGLATADMSVTLAFYRRLGLNLPPGAEDAPHVEAQLPGGLRLMWDTHESLRGFNPTFQPSVGATPTLAFLCADPTEVDRVHADLVNAGATSETAPWNAPWGQRYATLRDPDGHQLDLFAPTTAA